MRTPWHGRTWVWGLSALLTAASVAVSLLLPAPPPAPAAPVPQAAAASPAAPEPAAENWAATPAEVRGGWLTRSRVDRTPAFEASKTTVPLGEVMQLLPGVEDVPALDRPRSSAAASADWLTEEDLVLGVAAGGVARAYPQSVLVWHNVVNDTLGSLPVAVVMDPVSGAAQAFDRRVNGKTLSLGVSGKAWGGCALLYDREGRNLWHALTGRCVIGPLAGRATLKWVGAERSGWATWRKAHRDTTVLSRNTGYARAYGTDPYRQVTPPAGGAPVDYWTDPELLLAPLPGELPAGGPPAKTRVLGLCVAGKALAVLIPQDLTEELTSTVALGSGKLRVTCRPEAEGWAIWAADATGRRPWQTTCYWGAWRSVFPQSASTTLQGPG